MKNRRVIAAFAAGAWPALGVGVAIGAQGETSQEAAGARLRGPQGRQRDRQRRAAGAGDANGRGSFSAIIDGNKLCYGLTVANIGKPVAAHIHEAPRGENGDVVVDAQASEGRAIRELRASARTSRRRWRTTCVTTPRAFYVNVHNEHVPGRGHERPALQRRLIAANAQSEAVRRRGTLALTQPRRSAREEGLAGTADGRSVRRALLIVSFAVAGEPPDADESVAEIVDHYVDNKDSIEAGALIGGLAALSLLFFAGYLRKVFARRSPRATGCCPRSCWRRAAIMAVGAGVDMTISVALAEAAEDIDPVAVQALQALWDNDFMPIAIGLVVLLLLASGLSIVRYGALPKWLGWVAIVLGGCRDDADRVCRLPGRRPLGDHRQHPAGGASRGAAGAAGCGGATRVAIG